MEDRKRKPLNPVDDAAAPAAPERRRLSRVVHDDRGAASVEWVDAPAEIVDRPTLSIEDMRPAPRKGDGYNPYDREPGARPAAAPGDDKKPAAKRDLRKLSEWIKQMRALEERKRTPDEDGED